MGLSKDVKCILVIIAIGFVVALFQFLLYAHPYTSSKVYYNGNSTVVDIEIHAGKRVDYVIRSISFKAYPLMNGSAYNVSDLPVYVNGKMVKLRDIHNIRLTGSTSIKIQLKGVYSITNLRVNYYYDEESLEDIDESIQIFFLALVVGLSVRLTDDTRDKK